MLGDYGCHGKKVLSSETLCQTVKGHPTTEGISPYDSNDTGHCVISQVNMNAIFSVTIITLDCIFVRLSIWLLFFQAA